MVRRDILAHWCALAYLIIIPLTETLGLGQYFPGYRLLDIHRALAFLPIALLCLVAIPSVWMRKDQLGFFSPGEWLGWAVFFVLGALSSELSALPRAAWLEWSWVAIFFAFMVLLGSYLNRVGTILEQQVAIGVIAMLTTYTLAFYLYNADILFDPEPISTIVIYPGFNNLRVFSDYQTSLLFLIPTAVAATAKSVPMRLLGYFLGSAFFAVVFFTGSRSILLGHFVGCIVIVAFLKRRSFLPLIELGLYWIGGAVIYTLLSWAHHAGGVASISGFLRGTTSDRMFLWETALSLAINNPFFGVGPLHFSANLNSVAASPHNHLMQLMAEWGLPATGLFLILFYVYLRRIFALDSGESPESNQKFRAAVLAALGALCAQAMVSPVANNPISQMMMVWMLSLSVALSPRQPGRIEMAFSRSFSIFTLISLAIASSLLAAWAPWVADRNKCYIDAPSKPTPYYAPRFFEQGWLFPPCGGPEFDD